MGRAAYVVFRGRIPGVYETWEGIDEAKQQIHQFSNAYHRAYDNRDDAERAWRQWLVNHPDPTKTSYSRQSLSTRSTIDRSDLFAQGAFKNVYKGTYMNGPREGQACVSKEFITGGVYEAAYFQQELRVVKQALDLTTRFNDGDFVNVKVYMNEPHIWTYVDSDRNELDGQMTLVEPMIQNFVKFNSNTGWVPKHLDLWAKAMQALSHYSYHVSNRRFLLCDVQGGIYRDGFVLTDPVIMSTEKSFGPTDLGMDGISTFFARHRCNEFCRRSWSRPDVQVEIFNKQKGSAMLLPDRNSRQKLSKGVAQRIKGMTLEE